VKNSISVKLLDKAPAGFLLLRMLDPAKSSTLQQIWANRTICCLTGKDIKAFNGKLWKTVQPELVHSPMAEMLMLVAHSGNPGEWSGHIEGSVFSRGKWKFSAWCTEDLIVVQVQTIVRETEYDGTTMTQRVLNLEDQAENRKIELDSIIKELEAFTYSVSHDLRAPLRRLDGYSQELLSEYSERLDETGKHYLQRIRYSAQRMGELIDDLLKLTKISRQKIKRSKVDLAEISREVLDELSELEPDRNVDIRFGSDLYVYADKGLVRILLYNLLSNAWKFTSRKTAAMIEIGQTVKGYKNFFYIRDNGTGFDMRYAGKLFNAFQRLHSEIEFEGNGIGLATVRRIANLHGGDIWADSILDEGATFYFTLNSNGNQ
jgi:signal transduction histidine kinase